VDVVALLGGGGLSLGMWWLSWGCSSSVGDVMMNYSIYFSCSNFTSSIEILLYCNIAVSFLLNKDTQ
jgi:hypothetical protein